jgi:hypothetical protein
MLKTITASPFSNIVTAFKMRSDKTYLRKLFIICIVAVVITTYLEYASAYYNNYYIFTKPLINFLQEKTLYGFSMDLYMDTFKYSPFFAFIVGMLHWLPDYVGLFVWNLLNVLVLLRAVHLFFETDKDKIVVLLILLPSLIMTAHYEQSNGLVAGFILLALYYLRTGKSLWASLFTALCLFIKFYGFAVVILCVLYSVRKKYLLQLLGCIIVLAALPLFFVSFQYLLASYKEWFTMLSSVYLNIQCSVMGIAQSWFGVSMPLEIISIAGLLIFLFPLIETQLYPKKEFRSMLSASLLITIIIFNKMSEIPTYIIALVGLCIWWVNTPKKDWVDYSILFCVMLTQLLSLHYWPRKIMDEWLMPYSFTAVPYFVLWIKLQIQLWQIKPANNLNALSIIK